jgi:hypothetical protein
MLGSDFQVMIPDLSEIRLLEQTMDRFKQERKKFLESHEIGKTILTKIEKRETSNYVSNSNQIKDQTEMSLSKELNLAQVLEDKANVDDIWKDLEFDKIINQSKSIFGA